MERAPWPWKRTAPKSTERYLILGHVVFPGSQCILNCLRRRAFLGKPAKSKGCVIPTRVPMATWAVTPLHTQFTTQKRAKEPKVDAQNEWQANQPPNILKYRKPIVPPFSYLGPLLLWPETLPTSVATRLTVLLGTPPVGTSQ